MNFTLQVSGLIEAPPRSSLPGSVIILLVVAALSLALAVPPIVCELTYLILAGLLLLAVILRADYAVHIALFALMWLLIVSIVPFSRTWPLNILMPLIVYGVIAGSIPQLRSSIGWIKQGSIDSKVIKLMAVAVVISSAALVGWVLLTGPDIEHHLALIPELPLWVYPLAGVGFAVFNSLMEEAVFRGIMMEALDSAVGPGFWSVGIQAVSFAAFHYLSGFPNGTWGFILVLVYGVLLGMLRRSSKGMLTPLITHIAADITIFSILMVFFFSI